MRQLLPRTAVDGGLDDDDVVDDLDALYGADARPAPPDRPWLLINMITSIDGATSVQGVSGGLGGLADKQVFAAIRNVADIILVAAGTVRTEHYGVPDPAGVRREARLTNGRRARPRLAIVTGSLDLDFSLPLFTEVEERTIVFTTERSDLARRGAAAAVAEVVVVGTEQVDLTDAMAWFAGNDPAATVLCEGGPSLIGALETADLVDEVCLTISPVLVGGDSPRMANGADAMARRMTCRRVLEEDGYLFLRYARD